MSTLPLAVPEYSSSTNVKMDDIETIPTNVKMIDIQAMPTDIKLNGQIQAVPAHVQMSDTEVMRVHVKLNGRGVPDRYPDICTKAMACDHEIENLEVVLTTAQVNNTKAKVTQMFSLSVLY